jgi:hypothetical protein
MTNEILIGLAGLVLSVLTYLAGVGRTKRRHAKEDREVRVRRVFDTYMDLRRSNYTGGYDGLQKAGIATLKSNAEVQEVIDLVIAHGEKHPLGSNHQVVFRDVDLLRLFKYAADQRIDFLRVKIEDVIHESGAKAYHPISEVRRMDNLALRFIRWSAGLLVLGLLTGYGPLAHYLHGGVAVACPWAPIHGHVALLGWLGMAIFGLVYKALPSWANGASPSRGLAKNNFNACVVGVIGVVANGKLGYRIHDFVSDGGYYEPDKAVLNLWLSIDGVFLSLYGIGCGLFLAVVLGSTRYAPPAAAPEAAKARAI